MNYHLLVILLLAVVTGCAGCPPWTLPYSSAEDNTTQCQCGDSLGGVVDCNNETLHVSVLHCYCTTYNRQLNEAIVQSHASQEDHI